MIKEGLQTVFIEPHQTRVVRINGEQYDKQTLQPD